jgi:hypothetical protein
LNVDSSILDSMSSLFILSSSELKPEARALRGFLRVSARFGDG